MDLIGRKEQCKEELVAEVDAFIDSQGEQYLKPESDEPKESQIKELREKMIHRLIYEDFDVGRGMLVIKERLPSLVSPEEWEKALRELRGINDRVQKYFEEADRTQMPRIDEVMGLSRETFICFRRLLLHLFEKEDYDDAYELSLTMVAFFPDNIIGWLGTGRCLSWNGNNLRAIEVFENIQNMFPTDPVSRIFCGWSYMMVGEPAKSKKQFDQAEEMLQSKPDLYQVWEPVIEEMKHMF